MSLDDDAKTVVNQNLQGQLPAKLNYAPGLIVGGDYVLLRSIGRGGMGEVFAAEHKFIANRVCALKILTAPMVSARTWQRFEREARVLAKLNHPNIVQIYTMGVDRETCPFYVMELINGQTLAELLEENGRLDVDLALQIFLQVAKGLEFAHRHEVIHRDLKPSNIMILPGGAAVPMQVKLVDFGVAVLSHGSETQKLTEAGEAVGTPLYMSPEQISGQVVSASTDIYSFGCSLFEALTGKPPFKGANALETIHMHQHAVPPKLSEVFAGTDFGFDLQYLVARMLQKLPLNRYQSMTQVIHDIERLLEGKDITEAKSSTFIRPDLEVSPASSAGQFSWRWWYGALALSACALALFIGVPWCLRQTPALPASPQASLVMALPTSNPRASMSVGPQTGGRFPELNLTSQMDPKIEQIIAQSPPFNGAVEPNGARHFHFPRETIVGLFMWGDKKKSANGDFIVPGNVQPGLYISADYSCSAISKLRPDSLTLEVDIPNRESLQKLVRLTKDWHKLNAVCFTDYSFEQQDVDLMAKLPPVNQLSFFSCRFNNVSFDNCITVRRCNNLKLDVITEATVASYPPGLKSLLQSLMHQAQVERIEMHRLRWPMALTAILCQASSIKTIYFERCIVSPQAFQELCHKKNLENLSIIDSPFTYAEASAAIKTTPTVRFLTLTDTALDAKVASRLLGRGVITAKQIEPWTKAQIDSFKRAFFSFDLKARDHVSLGGLNFRPVSKFADE